MKKPHTALVSATPFNREIFERLPGLLDDLGPVKASSLRVASRAANVFRSGYPAREWEDLRPCRMVLVSAAPPLLEPLLAEMLDKLEPWPRRSVVLVGCGRDCRALEPFTARGARVASLQIIAETLDPVVLLEGDSSLVRVLQKRIGASGLTTLVLRRGASPLVELACALVRLTLPPLLETTLLTLRHAGLTPRESSRMLDSILTQSQRSFRKSGRRAWHLPGSTGEWNAIRSQIETLRQTEPEAAEYLMRVMEASLALFRRDLKWLWLRP